MYAWIWHVFDGKGFTIHDFRAVFPSPQPAKVLHDLVKNGYVQRLKRGIYRVRSPQEFIQHILEKDYKAMSIMEKADRPYAFSHNTAVMIWTSGYYFTGFTKGFKPLHVKILREDLPYWKEFFRENEARYTLENEKKTLYGFTYILHPEKEVEFVKKDNYNVVPLEEVIEFCLSQEAIYQPALEYLDEHYNIGYRKRAYIHT